MHSFSLALPLSVSLFIAVKLLLYSIYYCIFSVVLVYISTFIEKENKKLLWNVTRQWISLNRIWNNKKKRKYFPCAFTMLREFIDVPCWQECSIPLYRIYVCTTHSICWGMYSKKNGIKNCCYASSPAYKCRVFQAIIIIIISYGI